MKSVARDDKLDSRYEESAFFVVGRIFSTLWHGRKKILGATEKKHKMATGLSRGIPDQISRMVVVKGENGFYWCIPINTYQSRGVAKSGYIDQVDIKPHSICYSGVSITDKDEAWCWDGGELFSKNQAAIAVQKHCMYGELPQKQQHIKYLQTPKSASDSQEFRDAKRDVLDTRSHLINCCSTPAWSALHVFVEAAGQIQQSKKSFIVRKELLDIGAIFLVITTNTLKGLHITRKLRGLAGTAEVLDTISVDSKLSDAGFSYHRMDWWLHTSALRGRTTHDRLQGEFGKARGQFREGLVTMTARQQDHPIEKCAKDQIILEWWSGEVLGCKAEQSNKRPVFDCCYVSKVCAMFTLTTLPKSMCDLTAAPVKMSPDDDDDDDYVGFHRGGMHRDQGLTDIAAQATVEDSKKMQVMHMSDRTDEAQLADSSWLKSRQMELLVDVSVLEFWRRVIATTYGQMTTESIENWQCHYWECALSEPKVCVDVSNAACWGNLKGGKRAVSWA